MPIISPYIMTERLEKGLNMGKGEIMLIRGCYPETPYWPWKAGSIKDIK